MQATFICDTDTEQLKLIAHKAYNVVWKLSRKTENGWAKIDINDVVIRELKDALGVD